MSHQVIITFDLDETKVQENAEKEAGRQLATQIVSGAFGEGYSRNKLMQKYAVDIIRELLEPQLQEIKDTAIKEVVTSLSRSKIVRERLQEEIYGK